MFLWSQIALLRAETKTMQPYEWGILGVKAIALGWLSDERFPRDHRHQSAASLANRRARRDRVGRPPPMPNCTNSLVSCPARLHRKGGCPVHQLARSWLQYRLTLASSTVLSKSKQPRVKLSSLDCLCDRSLTSTPNNSSGTLAKTIKTINWSFLPPSYVYLTWLAMRLPYLLRGLRRIYKGLKHKKSRQKQQFFTKSDKHLYWLRR
jgi:hypothetical protein